MSIIYGTPLFFSGGTTILSSLPPLLDNFKAVSEPIAEKPSQVKITLSANKLSPEMATDLSGAVWVYGDHQPDTANDGRRIELQKDAVVGDIQSIVQQTFTWNTDKDFYVRQFTYNDKKQYQTMMYGATDMIRFVGVPKPVTDLQETHSGSVINLTWKNPIADQNFHHVVVAYGLSSFPATPAEGTSAYNGTGETAKIEPVTLGATYYISVFTISAEGLYGNAVQVSVKIPEGQLLSALPSGTKIKLGQYGGKDLRWILVRYVNTKAIRLLLDASSVSVLGRKCFDIYESASTDSAIQLGGNNRYIWSNIHQWINSDKPANEWYSAQHGADAPPPYRNEDGFLNGWTDVQRSALDFVMWGVRTAPYYGGSTETFQAKIALPSLATFALESVYGENESIDVSNISNIGVSYWVRTPNTSNSSPSNGRYITANGTPSAVKGDITEAGCSRQHSVRPMCAPKPETLVSLELDSDGCYTVVA